MPWNSDNENNRNNGNSPWGAGPQWKRGSGGNKGGGGGGGPRGPDVDLDEMFRRFSEKIRNFFSGGSSGVLGLIFLVLAGLWVASGIYRVQQGQEGVILRFGQYQRTTEPGLHIHAPFPIEQVYVVNVIQSRTLTIGIQNDRPSRAIRAGNDDIERVQRALEQNDTIETTSPEDNLVLTADRKMIDISVSVNWNIKNTRFYLFNIAEPELVVRDVAESVLREVIGLTDAEPILSTERSKAAFEIKDRMQAALDRYRSGVLVQAVNVLHATVPEGGVQAMYNDANAAENDAKAYIDQANAHRKLVVPRAQGQAKKIVNEALADKESLVQSAIGEKAKFEALLTEYQKQPDIIKRRLYLENVSSILEGKNKVLLPPAGQGGSVSPLQLLSINELMNNQASGSRK